MILIKSFLTEVSYNCFKLIYAYLNEGDKVREYYSCLKMIVQAHLHVGFSTIFFIKRASLKWFYLCMELLQSSKILKQKNYHELFYEIFCLKFFTTPNSKNIIATLRIVTNLSWHSLLYCISMINLN